MNPAPGLGLWWGWVVKNVQSGWFVLRGVTCCPGTSAVLFAYPVAYPITGFAQVDLCLCQYRSIIC